MLKYWLTFLTITIFSFIANSQQTIIYCGTLIDGISDEPKKEMTIITENNIIKSINKGYTEANSSDNLIDLKDKTVLPGFWDMHVHIETEGGPGKYINRFTNNDADVTLSMGGTVAAKIIEDKAQTLMSLYTIPAGKTGYLIKTQMGSDKASTNASLKYTLFARDTDDGNVFQIKGISYAAGGQNVIVEYPVPLKFEEKTDIKIDVVAALGGQTCSATFDIILVDNPT